MSNTFDEESYQGKRKSKQDKKSKKTYNKYKVGGRNRVKKKDL